MRPKEVEMSEETRKRVEAARDALSSLEELLPVDDATRARLYALRVTFGHIAGSLITRDPPSVVESDDVAPKDASKIACIPVAECYNINRASAA